MNEKYMVGELIGQGGFSKVYKAYRIDNDLTDVGLQELGIKNNGLESNGFESKGLEEVAIKIANSTDCKFDKEAAISQSSNFDFSIVKCIEHDQAVMEGEIYDYMIMKIAQGGDLLHYLKSVTVEERSVKQIFK
jgi:serine/threonine protein kinase